MKNEYFGLAICLMLFISCETATKSEHNKTSLDAKKNVKNADGKKIIDYDIENLVKEYNLKSDTSKIRFVDSLNCQSQGNMDLYYNDIYVYSISEIKKQKFDYNGDELDDYVISYIADNCWNGIGAGNYLSNYIFVTSTNRKLVLNNVLTDLFRSEFQKFVIANLGKMDYDYAKTAQFINGIEFKSSIGETVSGSFIINTPKCETAQPCISGTFDFNTKSGHIEFIDIQYGGS